MDTVMLSGDPSSRASIFCEKDSGWGAFCAHKHCRAAQARGQAGAAWEGALGPGGRGVTRCGSQEGRRKNKSRLLKKPVPPGRQGLFLT